MVDALKKIPVQWFPLYYPMGPRAFTNANGDASGALGAQATLTKDISNFPIMFWGLRITNVYTKPSGMDFANELAYKNCKNYVDSEQTVRIEISQQNITAEATLQTQMMGLEGQIWSPFPVPFGMAGGNNISVVVTRSSEYPTLTFPDPAEPGEFLTERILPVCYATIVASVAREGDQTMPPLRRSPY